VAKVLIFWALIYIGEPNINYIINIVWSVSSLQQFIHIIREHSSQIVRGMQTHYDSAAFVMSWEGGDSCGVAKVLFLWALIHVGDPNIKYIINTAWSVSVFPRTRGAAKN